uniref:NUP50 domain-containing protein n=1 Tax=Echinostoma caproni TaxID=27848 RepID=A0A183B947_9TREM
LFSLTQQTPGSLFTSSSASTSEFPESKSVLFSSSSNEPVAPISGAGGLFGTTRPFAVSTAFSPGLKVCPFNEPTTGSSFESLAAAAAAADSSVSNLFKPSVMSTSTPPKFSLFGHSTAGISETTAAVTTTAVVSTTSTATTEGGSNRPKIQPIVWDYTALPSSSDPQSTEESRRIGAGRRKKWGSAARTGLFSGTGPSTTPGSLFGASRGAGTSGPGPLRTKPHPRR